MTSHLTPGAVTLGRFQQLIEQTYLSRDQARGVEGTFMWLLEEIGELATALRSGSRQAQAEEFADVLAWLATIANVAEVNLEDALVQKYGEGCPGCRQVPCACDEREKP